MLHHNKLFNFHSSVVSIQYLSCPKIQVMTEMITPVTNIEENHSGPVDHFAVVMCLFKEYR